MADRSPWWRALWIALGLCVLGFLVVQLRSVLTPVLFALLLAYVLDPVVDLLEARNVPRSLGIVILLLGVLLGVSLFVVLVVPTLVRDLSELVRTLFAALVRLVLSIRPWLIQHDIPVPQSLSSALDQLGDNAVGMASSALAPVRDVLFAAIGGTATALGSLSTALFVPVFSFYFLHDFDRIVVSARDLLPAGVRPAVVAIATRVDHVIGQFVRGQLTVMGILAVLYGFGYWLIGVPLAVPIGLLAGVLSFIPYVGSTLALVFGLLMVALHWTGWTQILGVVAVYGVVQLLEGLVITPRVVGGKLGLSPVWVLFALLAFGNLFGFLGVMLALPVSAVIKVFVVDAVTWYRGTALYLGVPAAGTLAPRPARLRVRRARRRGPLRRMAR
ncbi:MAG TPA: AI-2E family transporter [Polyangiales bacterium]|nr:AI-2E family transporter [Polyangiales bacterium]